MLGALPDVAWIKATGPQQTSHTWPVPDDTHSYPRWVHGKAGDPIEVPYMGHHAKPARDELSLLILSDQHGAVVKGTGPPKQ